jgi:2-polyprenyl-6-methoxyphenol hydroxylase-like FAD-dependent oxidoreductase
MYNPYGDLVWREDRGRSAGYDWPQLAISRSHLITTLAADVRRRLGDRSVVTDARLVRLDPGAGRTRAVFADQQGTLRSVETDVLIGADGVHSAVRAVLHPDEGPTSTNGFTLYRGTAWADTFLTGGSMAVLGDDRRRLVLYPIERRGANKALVNWVAAFPEQTSGKSADPGAGTTADADPAATDPRTSAEVVLDELGCWSPPGVDLACLLASTPRIQRYPMIDRDPLPRWTFDRVTLLGDAAHAMYPAGSNGATQAIVDARVLACYFGSCPDPGEALQAYEDERRPQMTELQHSNRSMDPERVITLAYQRAPLGFKQIGDVFSEEELAEISRSFAVTGKFDKDWVNFRPSLSVSHWPAVRRDTRSEE